MVDNVYFEALASVMIEEGPIVVNDFVKDPGDEFFPPTEKCLASEKVFNEEGEVAADAEAERDALPARHAHLRPQASSQSSS